MKNQITRKSPDVMQELLDKYLDEHYALGTNCFYQKDSNCTPLLLYNLTKDLMQIFAISYYEVETYLVMWVVKQNKLFDFGAYWEREGMCDLKLALLS